MKPLLSKSAMNLPGGKKPSSSLRQRTSASAPIQRFVMRSYFGWYQISNSSRPSATSCRLSIRLVKCASASILSS